MHVLVQKLWKSWSTEYLSHFEMFGKSNTPTLNIQVAIGDVVCVRDEHLAPTKLHLTQVVDIHPR